jgi:hypothetical protein
MANAFLNLGHLIFNIFWRSMDPPDSAPPPLVVAFFGTCIFILGSDPWCMLSKLVLCYIPKSIVKILSALKYIFSVKT